MSSGAWAAIGDMESFKAKVEAWTRQRNSTGLKVNWRFTTKDARIKLKRLPHNTLITSGWSHRYF